MVRRLTVVVAAYASATAFVAAEADVPNTPQRGKIYPACHVHKTKAVHFANATSKDILEISVGTGPCYAATLTIVVRTEYGEILYSYVDHFKKHIVTHWSEVDVEEATNYLDKELKNATYPASQLPKWEELEDYYENNYQTVQIPKAQYEALIKSNARVLSHLTYYEGWRTVTYDEKSKKAVIVTDGGL
jgi:hypothetical protein